MPSRRDFLRTSLVGSAALAVAALPATAFARAPIAITVYKSPSCGCCAKWVEHLEKNGFAPAVRDMENVDEVKDTFGVPNALRSCHTASVGKYVVEGHVPAADIQRLLREHPAIAGLAAPGMPNGAPGMEGGRTDRYDVIAFDRAGKTSIFQHH